ncbi:MAG TPA: CAP domain-containing protein [Bryobacteraceae bacterium]|nr:CAP domain-containing protein [Bryobacteraceae bacterium]
MPNFLKLPLTIILAGTLSGADESLTRQMLAAHNAIRKRVGVPSLTWSTELAAGAQQWADTLLRNGNFQHQSRNPYGENLFEITGAAATPVEVVNDWASEARDYNYKTNSCSAVCGHYTQVVWRDTKEVGCGVAQNQQRQVWVCEYNPPGNIVGERPY